MLVPGYFPSLLTPLKRSGLYLGWSIPTPIFPTVHTLPETGTCLRFARA